MTTSVAFAGPLIPAGFLPDSLAWGNWPANQRVSNREGDMPRIDDSLLKGVAFMYRTRGEAERRVKLGGSAFVVGRRIPSSEHVRGGAYVPYLVSNRHVVFNGGASVATVNRRDGSKPAILEYEPTDWTAHPDGDDLAAICVFGDLESHIHEVSYVRHDQIVDPPTIRYFDIGVGDEVVMIGRFMNHQGRDINRPAARFGSISMMPEPIWNKALGRDQLSYAVEMRSRTGFSGSPVAIYRTPSTVLTNLPPEKQEVWGLLGVNWGYILDEEDENGKRENTWLNGVVPGWKILELLDVPRLKSRQEELEARWHEQQSKTGNAEPAFAPMEAGEVPEDEEPSHRERFKRLLDAAVKRPKSSD